MMLRIFTKIKSVTLFLAVNLLLVYPGKGHSLDLQLAAAGQPITLDQPRLEGWHSTVGGPPDVNDNAAHGELARVSKATRQWVLKRLLEDLSYPLKLNRISSALYGLVSDPTAVKRPDTRNALAALDTFIRAVDQQNLGCSDLVNLRLINSFLTMAGIASDKAWLDRRLYECLTEMHQLDRASALFSLCRFPSAHVSREKLLPAMKSIEEMQQADGSFGFFSGLHRYYLTTHAVFALHACDEMSVAVRRGQVYLRNELPDIQQAGFLDGLLESMIMLRKMGVEIPNQGGYTNYLRSRIKDDGSMCFFDRPGCRSDVHAISLLLEFIRGFGS